jgi:hypothetical protein
VFDPTDDLASLFDEWGEVVTYSGGAAAVSPLYAIPSHEDGEAFPGLSEVGRVKTFELRQADMTRRPAKQDTVTDSNAVAWRVIQTKDRDEHGTYVIAVEEVA